MTGKAGELDGVFFAESGDLLATARAVLETFDFADHPDQISELHRCAHSIKGAALMLGFDGCGELAAALANLLESMPKWGSDHADALLPLVHKGFDALHALLESLANGADRESGNAQLRLDLSNAASHVPESCRRIDFRLSPLALVSPFLVDDMLDELGATNKLVGVKVEVTSADEQCWVELSGCEDVSKALKVIEQVADPGSLHVDSTSSGDAAKPSDPVPVRSDQVQALVTHEVKLSEDQRHQRTSSINATQASPSHTSSSTSGSTEHCLAIQLGVRWFAVKAGVIDRVTAETDIEPYPVQHPGVLGIIEVEGEFIRVFDLRACLGLGRTQLESGMQLIISLGDEPVGVQVDHVEDMIEVCFASVKALPGMKQPGILGVTRYRNSAVWVLDLAALLDSDLVLKRASLSVQSRQEDQSRMQQVLALNEELEAVVSAYGGVYDDSLGFRALALSLALEQTRNAPVLHSSLANSGLNLMRSLSARLDVLGSSLANLAYGCDQHFTSGLSEQAKQTKQTKQTAVNHSADRQQVDHGARSKPTFASSKAQSVDDTNTNISAPVDQNLRPPSSRRSRAMSSPLPRIGRGRNPLKDQWND